MQTSKARSFAPRVARCARIVTLHRRDEVNVSSRAAGDRVAAADDVEPAGHLATAVAVRSRTENGTAALVARRGRPRLRPIGAARTLRPLLAVSPGRARWSRGSLRWR